MYIYMYIYKCEKLFTKTHSLNMALALQAHFLEWCLVRFGKELFIYVFVFICRRKLWIKYCYVSLSLSPSLSLSLSLSIYIYIYIYIHIYIYIYMQNWLPIKGVLHQIHGDWQPLTLTPSPPQSPTAQCRSGLESVCGTCPPPRRQCHSCVSMFRRWPQSGPHWPLANSQSWLQLVLMMMMMMGIRVAA